MNETSIEKKVAVHEAQRIADPLVVVRLGNECRSPEPFASDLTEHLDAGSMQHIPCSWQWPSCMKSGCSLHSFSFTYSSFAELCGALNVTVSPGPVVDYLEGENATLLCHVSQKRRKDSLLAVRWFFAPDGSQEALMVKMTKLRVIQYYGNFSRTANQQRLRLLEERRGVLYRLSVLTLRPADQGQYVCKVQEISKHRNKWTAWSNGSSATEMRGKRGTGVPEEVQSVGGRRSPRLS